MTPTPPPRGGDRRRRAPRFVRRLVLTASLVLSSVATTQEIGADAARSAVVDRSVRLGQILMSWVEGFENGRYGLSASAPTDLSSGPPFCRAAVREGFLPERNTRGWTYLDVLRRLVWRAERMPSVGVARVLLPLAALGFEERAYDYHVRQVRDLGHFSLLRMERADVWVFLQRVAAGEPVAWHDDAGTGPRPLAPAFQIAALRLLGTKNEPTFRSAVEQRLLATDERVRLAAAEALGHMKRPQALPVVARALGVEEHAIVAQALVQATRKTLEAHDTELPMVDRYRAVTSCVRRLGEVGWRTDLDIVGIAERWPCIESIPALIDVLEANALDVDKKAKKTIRDVVNEHASPVLRYRAWNALRILTGAILPIEDIAAWRAFWEKEKDTLVLAEPERNRLRPRTSSGAQFFGIPVLGRETAFVIDTSGSMKETVVSGRTFSTDRARKNPPSRLDVAKQQMLQAVQSMHSESKYHLFTFDTEVRVWNRRPVPPTRSSFRALTETLGKLAPNGGTNFHDALVAALSADQMVWGQQQRDDGIDEVFVLSDGEATEGIVHDSDTLLEIVRELNRYQNIRINTVFAGTGEGADFMRRLAEENDGSFVQV